MATTERPHFKGTRPSLTEGYCQPSDNDYSDRWLGKFGSEGRICSLKCSGYTYSEVAHIIQMDVKEVKRIFKENPHLHKKSEWLSNLRRNIDRNAANHRERKQTSW